jgi:serine/threonine protein kinase
MNNFPDFSEYGYKIVRELGQNRAGGRVTYLATEINTGYSVVVKQFQFSRSGSWSDYQAYDREIQVLKELDSPNIPRYLDSFQTPEGFCMIQEYKQAPSLATLIGKPEWATPQRVKQIAIAILEILNYLQQRIPPVIHRDLKPENILVDEQLNVYLVDFGFARLGGGEVAASSVVKGTLGFMPPEQMFNRQLTVSSDLYSLGATLICLLTGTPSIEVGSLMDDKGQIHFRDKTPHLSLELTDWLAQMVAANYKNRYQSAAEALNTLLPRPVLRPQKSKANVWVACTAALGIFGVGYLGYYGLQPIFRSQSQSSQTLDSPGTFNAILTHELTDRFEPGKAIESTATNQKSVYFYVTAENLTETSYEGLCRVFDRSGKVLYVGKFPLAVNRGRLQSWCSYPLDRSEIATGDLRFEFYLNSEKVAEKTLRIEL